MHIDPLPEGLIRPQRPSPREPWWRPSPQQIERSQLTDFIGFCGRALRQRFESEADFHAFSVAELRQFWALFLQWSGVIYDGVREPVCTDDRCEQAVFFPEVRLGYVENLLRCGPGLRADSPAVTSVDGAGRTVRLTRGQLAEAVYRAAGALEALGVRPGDRVVAVVQNDERAVIAALAAAALGASLSTVAPDVGPFSIIARFRPLEPVVLVAHAAALGDRLPEVIRGLPQLKALITLDDAPAPAGIEVPTLRFDELCRGAAIAPRRFPFNQPLFTLFSSGTTGAPKCIVHGAGGTLLEHLKEHRLHLDLGPSDKLLFQTTCSWMMWNWQLSALATGAELVVYSGPAHQPAKVWSVVATEQLTVFGTSPAFLRLCEHARFAPPSLPALRLILSTGSILYDDQYDWLSEHQPGVPVHSISGGTDIIGCFVLGNPNLPIYRGESSCRSLGMDVQAHAPVNGVGELVCRNPFPSRPLGFAADPGGARFHDAYFTQHPGVWTHGDLIELTDRGTVRLHGRSDAVLNVGGIRIGPVEIYRILGGVPEVAEALAVEQELGRGESRLVLLVVLRPGKSLDALLKRRIRAELLEHGSPAHVPHLIVAVSELPTTMNGKRSERAAADVVNGRQVANTSALRNPASLDELERALTHNEAAAAPAHGDPLEATVKSCFERLLDAGPVSPHEDFFELGGTSLLAVRLVEDLRRSTGRELPPSCVFEARSISGIAQILRQADGAVSASVQLRGGQGAPLFLIPGLAGDVLELRALSAALPPGTPVIGLRARGLRSGEDPHRSIDAMVNWYLEHLRRLQPAGPYALLGYSFGGIVVFEMARRLRELGAGVALVGLLDTLLDRGCLDLNERLAFELARARDAAIRRLDQRMPALGVVRPLAAAVRSAISAGTPDRGVESRAPVALGPAMLAVQEHAYRAFEKYRPRPAPLPITFFRAKVRLADYCDPGPLWRRASCGQLEVVDVEGDHFSMVRPPHVTSLAQRVADALSRGLRSAEPRPRAA